MLTLRTLEPLPQEAILSTGANKKLLPCLERVRSGWEGEWREWDFPGSLFVPGPRELSKRFLPGDLTKALTQDVPSVLIPMGSRIHGLRMCPSDLAKSYPC